MTVPGEEYFGVHLAGSVRLAIPLTAVESVLRISPQRICPIPGVPTAFLGVTNQKGALVWVVDLSQYLGMSSSPLAGGSSPSLLTAVLRLSEPSPEPGGRARLCRAACIVTQLEGIYNLSAQQLYPLPAQLKPEIRCLFDGLVVRTAVADTDLIQDKSVAVTEQVRVAILNPQALFAMLQEEPHHHSPAGPSPVTAPAPLLPI